jgi:MORN repeat
MALLRGVRLATGAAMAFSLLALTVATAQRARPCDVVEPDSLGISWTAPCDEGRWLLDPQSGCRLWDWHPAPEDTSTWTGACPAGRKEGRGVVQWVEHGRPIDRFEGVYRRGKREGFGRYDWPTGDRFEGTYTDDLPNGRGTVTIDGASFSGAWRRGCLVLGEKRIAIGVPLGTCGRSRAS